MVLTHSIYVIYMYDPKVLTCVQNQIHRKNKMQQNLKHNGMGKQSIILGKIHK